MTELELIGKSSTVELQPRPSLSPKCLQNTARPVISPAGSLAENTPASLVVAPGRVHFCGNMEWDRQAIWDQTNSTKGDKKERKKEFSPSSIRLRGWELERPPKSLPDKKVNNDGKLLASSLPTWPDRNVTVFEIFLLTFSSLTSGENESDQDHTQQHYHLDRQPLSLGVPSCPP